jgi:hypothetical protein
MSGIATHPTSRYPPYAHKNPQVVRNHITSRSLRLRVARLIVLTCPGLSRRHAPVRARPRDQLRRHVHICLSTLAPSRARARYDRSMADGQGCRHHSTIHHGERGPATLGCAHNTTNQGVVRERSSGRLSMDLIHCACTRILSRRSARSGSASRPISRPAGRLATCPKSPPPNGSAWHLTCTSSVSACYALACCESDPTPPTTTSSLRSRSGCCTALTRPSATRSGARPTGSREPAGSCLTTGRQGPQPVRSPVGAGRRRPRH